MNYLFKRIGSAMVVIVLASIIVFLIIHLIPGDPAEIIAGPGVPQDEVEKIRVSMGLDKPLVLQYLNWIKNISRGEFGKSLITGDPILELTLTRFYNTFQLAAWGILFAVVCGIPLGIIAAVKHNTLADVIVMIIAIIGISMPIFWIGLLLVLLLAVNMQILPATGNDTYLHLILPSITIGLNSMAIIARMTRSSMLEVLKQDYIITAEAKGLRGTIIVFKHALKNSMIPIITTIGIQFGYLLGGAVLTETVFVYPGIGSLLVESIKRRDYPIVQVCILLISIIFVVVNLFVDFTYFFFNPKLRNDS